MYRINPFLHDICDCENLDTSVLKILFYSQRNININIKNKFNMTAEDIIYEYCDDEWINILNQYKENKEKN